MHVEDRDVGGLLAGRGLGRGEAISRLPAGALPLAGTPSFDNAHPVRSFPTTTVTGAIPEPTDTDTLPTPSKSRTRWPRPTSSGEPTTTSVSSWSKLDALSETAIRSRPARSVRPRAPDPGDPVPVEDDHGTASSAGPRTRRRAPASTAPRSAGTLQRPPLRAAAARPRPCRRPERLHHQVGPVGVAQVARVPRAFSSVSRTTWSPAVTPGAGSSSIEPRSSPSRSSPPSCTPPSSSRAPRGRRRRSSRGARPTCRAGSPTAVAACRPGRPSASPTSRPGRESSRGLRRRDERARATEPRRACQHPERSRLRLHHQGARAPRHLLRRLTRP